ncbi:hypothetical protein B0I72DRAFT_103499 [Yarrowia lipolytica]|uniref:YALI0D17666p n=2 Tax=Yarrowia lipolytica TaxID=4952 RepID=Q6C8R2_YARLI|nr:YALI0D17666p [Yarrowia lipolytica CLIB122]AOW04203.1 hypothetical protein YALI1_D21610g [Yarrowia lipolytica]KAB8281907.1 hypothetical protein BKA91DRAFT_114617 [Yarrowia lipolytica]KAE8169089.1 hypothetical protein BKA90DRAFT_104999 [Yarrowia lipolytica]KAJ8054266.1 hypothetical protein LXG23DRAFT_55831 [Yarrowia lipolytica]QNP97918.1 UPF0183 protein [Yarrowia lipolytica]|eukprot:XP_502950.1 YALI0D17666p [Yarrowia lipolytica CLIB122]
MSSLAIKPGIGLGPFILGMDLYDCLQFIKKHHTTFPLVNVIYSSQSPLSNFIVADMPRVGLRLQFGGVTQKLLLIEVYNFTPANGLALEYNETALPKGNISLRAIYGGKLFGPTYAGEYKKELEKYVLSYPGVAFSFNVDAQTVEKNSLSDSQSFIKHLSSSETTSMAIFKGPTWWEALKELNQEGADVSHQVSLRPQKGEIYFPAGKVTVGSTTMQDIVAMFGSPEEKFVRKDSALSIHRKDSSKSTRTESGHVTFFNYFRLGIDFCFSNSGQLLKVIFHHNIPGTIEFQRYSRARWSLEASNHVTVTSEMDYTELAQKLDLSHSKGLTLAKAMESPSSSIELVNGGNEVFPDSNWGMADLCGMDGAVFEFCKQGSIASVTIY